MSWAEEAKSEIANRLGEVFGNDLVRAEWRSHAENEDWLKFKQIYTPYPDIAVGPLNIHPGEQGEKEKGEIKEIFKQHGAFFQNLLGKNVRNFPKNKNPRCLLAIEVEGSGTGKHMIGNIINASILGYIGIVVVNENNDKLWEDAKRVKKYLDGASVIKKTEPIAKNAMVFEYNQFMDRLEKAMRSRRG